MSFALSIVAALALAGDAKGPLIFDVSPGSRFEFGDALGARIDRNVEEWLLRAPTANPGMLEMFRVRDRTPEPQIVPWAGEFAGKYLISAVQALRMTDRADLQDRVASFVSELLLTQAEDGYLGPFPKRDRLLANWDLWGHYHVMLGLLLWHERTGDGAVLKALVRAADLICGTFLDAKRRPHDAGSQEMNLAVIHVLGRLHGITENERYLRLMHEIEKDWERTGDYFRQGLAGVDFFRTPRPRWESLHDLQGLVELYRITGDERYRTAFVNLWRSIARLDRHNTGGFSSGEQAVGQPYSPAPIETCCTIAWMAITVDMLRLTGDPQAADELELSTWNGMLGAQHPSGRWWTYSTPMDGVREASAHAIVFQARAGTPELNCCSVNGPRGLGMLSEWAVMADAEGLVVNHFGRMKAWMRLRDGARVSLEEVEAQGGAGVWDIIVRPERPAELTLKIRSPGWSSATEVTAPGDASSRLVPPGAYVSVRRTWRDGDQIRVKLDQRLRVVAGDLAASGKVSIYKGPQLLAYDPRFNPIDRGAVPAIDASGLTEISAGATEKRGTLDPIQLVQVKSVTGETLTLCDFASAGATGTRYVSWLPAVNTPPPPVVLQRPLNGARLPPGKSMFEWGWRRRPAGVDFFDLQVLPAGEGERVIQELRVTATRAGVELLLEPNHEYRWRVIARGPHGSTASETRTLRIDAAAAPSPLAGAEAPEPGPDGVLVSDPLRGLARPTRGLLQDVSGVTPAGGPAADTSSTSSGSVAFDGEQGRLRYFVPWFPERDCSVTLLLRVRALPRSRIAQVFSAWAGPSDDPLRITVDGGKLFARVETRGASFSTEGVPLEPGKWLHVAAVKSGAKLSLWIEGEERAGVAVPDEVWSQANNIALGGNPNFGGNEFLAGDIADFALLARPLSREEVRRAAGR